VGALSDEALLAAGLSRAKARYVAALAEAALRGELAAIEALPDDEVVARLVTIPGVGAWTAKMFLLFHLRRPDVFSGDDLGLRLGIALLEGRPTPPSAGEAEARAELWQPYRSVASLVLWDLVRRTRAERTATGARSRKISSPFRVVRATRGDLDTIVEILEEAAAWLLVRGIVQWQVGEFRGRQRDSIAAGIERGELHLARLGQSVVGTTRLQWNDERCWPGVPDDEAGYVHSLAVRRNWAGLGIGRRMLEWAEAEVAAAGRPYVRLDCVADNQALVRYYENGGFVSRGQTKIEWEDGGASVQQRFEKRVTSR
jgi:ribosomal protein S18 acetylase RimI-like enzyme